MENPRRIYNPIQKDYVTFLKTSDETNGEYTLVEVELASKGGVGLHYHKTYTEKFSCLEGELKVEAGNTIHTLLAGQTVTADIRVNHRFFNTSDSVCKFQVELRPASKGFEQSLQIGYGLARDGQTNSKGFPKNRLALAWLFDISESNLPGWLSFIEFILRWQAKKARAAKLDKELLDKYVKF
jgi:quercetin dioxygenase-like cupin family protein